MHSQANGRAHRCTFWTGRRLSGPKQGEALFAQDGVSGHCRHAAGALVAAGLFPAYGPA